ncbi:MAG: CDP-glycerol glycerophosphotransferase family protein [Muribaculaceae bacterium]|nr:CDP-glycerol glycerophosphotransferase family protein [Muribaculaceae bacterium]
MKKLVRLFYKKILPKFIKKRIILTRWHVNQYNRKTNELVSGLTYSQYPIKVLFIISTLPMWRGQGLYNLLAKDERFDPRILIVPFKRVGIEEGKMVSKEIANDLSRISIKANNLYDQDFNIENFLKDFNPNIVFPCQPYDGMYGNQIDDIGKNRIVCYIPYGLNTVFEEFAYNTKNHNYFWKVYQASFLHFKTAKRLMVNNAKNVVIVGEPDYDKFIQEDRLDPWKKFSDEKTRKRIIWAPHFSINPNNLLHRASFLWLYEEMLKIAKEYKDKIQIAFKPHPNLHSVLVNLTEWGEERTNEYYNKWSSMENTQLEEGNFIDLFKYSDAMIHDSGSFTGEYMFVNKPVMFTTKDIKSIRNRADDFGLKCLDLHYIGEDIEDIREFIENVVLGEKDTMKDMRAAFYNDYLIPPNGNTVAQNIYNDLLSSFGYEPLSE